MGLGDYEQARNEFGKVINEDQGELREKCLYLMGYSYIAQGKYLEAVKPFTDLINLYPSGQYFDNAQTYLEKIKT